MGTNRRRFFQHIAVAVAGFSLFRRKLFANDKNLTTQVNSNEIFKVFKEPPECFF